MHLNDPLKFALTVLLALLLAPQSEAQRRGRDVPANDPGQCPYCRGNPERMAAAGIVSHGPFPFARADTTALDELLSGADIHWIETSHLRIGVGLAPYRLRTDERRKVRAELESLATVLPGVPVRTTTLDPWLQAHLWAQRTENMYSRFLSIVRKTPEDFPPEGSVWMIDEPFRGVGPYLGMAEKFELLLLPNTTLQREFMREQYGLDHVFSQRWHVVERKMLSFSMATGQDRLTTDTAVHGHVAFNLAINFLDGYKLYAYELPPWLREGLGHVFEREVDPRHNSRTMSEGGIGEVVRRSDWLGEVRKLVRADRAPRLAELSNLQSYGDMNADHHLVAWSFMDYLVRAEPEALARMLEDLKGRTTPDGRMDGSNLRDHVRTAFRTHLSATFPQFDQRWRDWVLSPAALGQGSGEGLDDEPPEEG
jgi:hypothetical protein